MSADLGQTRQREARAEDAAALAALVGTPLPDPAELRAASGRLWVIEAADGALVACGGVAARPQAGLFRLMHVAVVPAWRRQGLAARLLMSAHAFAAAAGADALEAWVPVGGADDAQGFLTAAGMVRQPGIRARHDAGGTLEYGYRMKTGFMR